jgi:C-terminal processing protease CtpA/Prc
VKWVSPNGPADLAGLLPGDHVLQVDGESVVDETHMKVHQGLAISHGPYGRLGCPWAWVWRLFISS